MDEIAAPFGENETRQSAHKKIFELPTGSPADFFMYISPRLILSKFALFNGYGNQECETFRKSVKRYL